MPDIASPPTPTRHESATWSFRSTLALALIALVLVAYHGARYNGFHLDDASNIVSHGPVHMTELSLESLRRAWTDGLLPQRPLPNLTFAVDWWRGGGSAAPFQITNIVIHAATTLAVLALLLHVLAPGRPANRREWLAAAAATAIWAVHPIQIQAVTYIVQRMASLAALFMLLSVTAFIRARSPCSKRTWYVVAAITGLAACLSKENAFVLPALYLLAEYTVCRAPGEQLRSGLDKLLLSLPAFFVIYAVVDLAIVHGPLWHYVSPGYASRDFTLVERLLTQPRVIAFHLGQILWPLPARFSIEHDFPLSTGLFSPWTTAPAIIGVLAWIGGGVWLALRTRHLRAGFLMLWIPLTLVIESSIISLEMVFEHRMYLPSVGLAGLLALGLQAVAVAPMRRIPLASATAAVTIALLVGTVVRLPVWRTPATLYEHATEVAPNSPRTWTNLATAYETENRSEDAIRAYTKALELDPRRAIAYLNRGSSFRKMGRMAEAETDYQRVIALEPNDFRGPYALGALYNAIGNAQAAEQWLLRANALDTNSPLPLYELAGVLLDTNRPQAAQRALDEALSRDPVIANADFFDLQGMIKARTGQYTDAIDAFTQEVRSDPARPLAFINRGFAYLRNGNFTKALADFELAIELEPLDARAHYGRSETLKQLGQIDLAIQAATRTLSLAPNHERARQLLDQLKATQTQTEETR
ncbi:MAG TPA: tetratricopeptide repeat protein [Aromatoleum sp.]|uniref:tetratricopeptide repeat protein n=1 Tax=Aromatoleum sp. TaxID=2307007 RepID=UPI002B49EBA2|nr:tetratricopeptide repeat protein [Aromatoleum sp.]HJV25448.1 tetratricopeptide repeat protein [Aromatoleum sp.]